MAERLENQEATPATKPTIATFELAGRTIDQGIVVTKELLDLSITRRLMGLDSTKIDDALYSLSLSLADATLRFIKVATSQD